MQLIIVSGRSGSGKSVTLSALEDLGYTAVDNCPIPLLEQLLTTQQRKQFPLAISLDARNYSGNPETLRLMIDALKHSETPPHIIYLDSKDSALIKRFGETRRTHPLASPELSLLEALQEESTLLSPLAESSDTLIETTELSLSQLNARIKASFILTKRPVLQLLVMSFGYKHGKPQDADFIFDVRSLPNPYWEPDLRACTGLDAPVIQYFSAQPAVQEMLVDIDQFLQRWIPSFEAEHRCYLTVAIGCTGGQHRSVYLAEQLLSRQKKLYPSCQLRHRHLKQL